ncbi:MAG: bifunctional phosphopantothenoylcysteine decarboxylase/phosphopantothenate--cysteine ligase CoaBC [Chromatiales bacterium]
MGDLVDKRILLGVSGGIAAYKAAELVRLLKGAGAEVQVVMTAAATELVGPLTFQALSGRPVRHTLLDPAQEGAMGHIELARWADLVLVAPATADCMARLAHGMADDLLAALCLVTEAPVALAPAMNRAMWAHPATRENTEALLRRGTLVWGPGEGGQACGDSGPGRMREPRELLSEVEGLFAGGSLAGTRVLITAGPTREPLDPVRFLSNRSSGKMGYALAGAFARAGARVQLVSGPVCLTPPRGVQRLEVESAEEMHAEVMRRVHEADIFVGCAAVADYRPARPAGRKIKKDRDTMEVELIRNPDILADVAAARPRPFCVGFAAETEDLEERGQAKRRSKGVDVVAANLVGAARGGFEKDENALTLLWEGGRRELAMAPKGELAKAVVEAVAERYHAGIATTGS